MHSVYFLTSQSYLTLLNFCYCLLINNLFSDLVCVKYGVPQSSILFPVLLILYNNELHLYLNGYNSLIQCAEDTDYLVRRFASSST